jgi:hypothetical protein
LRERAKVTQWALEGQLAVGYFATLDVPNFQTVEEAEAFLITKITALVGTGDLSLFTALDLATLVRTLGCAS